MTLLKGNTFFEGPAGRIEALIKEPKRAIAHAAIVCHPHPLHGGTLHNKVVYRIARAFYESGFAVMRFNFRGVGLSSGQHDYGRGEQEDLLAAIDFIQQKYPDAELWLSGFSFGARVMLEVGCRKQAAVALVAVGLPVSKYDFDDLISCNKPKLLVQGALDEFGSVTELERLAAKLTGPTRVVIIEGADHFLEGHLHELEQIISDFISSTIQSGFQPHVRC
jgi:alpha/beta superfamily hydrolase